MFPNIPCNKCEHVNRESLSIIHEYRYKDIKNYYHRFYHKQCNVYEYIIFERAINAIIQAVHPRIHQEEETVATKTSPVNAQSKKRPSSRQMQ